MSANCGNCEVRAEESALYTYSPFAVPIWTELSSSRYSLDLLAADLAKKWLVIGAFLRYFIFCRNLTYRLTPRFTTASSSIVTNITSA